jgi:hypothetical protein
MHSRKMIGAVFLLVSWFLFFPSNPVLADSAYVELLIAGTSRDIGDGSISLEGGFSVCNGTGHYWSGGNYYTVDMVTGAISNMGAPGSVLSNGYGDPFGMYDATTNTFYAATYYGAGDSYIYKYDYATSTWSDAISAINIYGGDFYNGGLYISGLREPWSGGYDTNYISLFDFSGSGNHDALIETGGASAHVALDGDGNVYYVPYGSDAALYRWTADQVASVVNDLAAGDTDTYLTLAEGEKLSDMPGGGNGITVDDAGNVFITTNGSEKLLLMWNGEAGDGDNYTVLGTCPEEMYMAWYGPMDIEGDFTQGDALYASLGYGGSFTEIVASPVPVPAAVWLLGSGLFGLIGIRRKHGKT